MVQFKDEEVEKDELKKLLMSERHLQVALEFAQSHVAAIANPPQKVTMRNFHPADVCIAVAILDESLGHSSAESNNQRHFYPYINEATHWIFDASEIMRGKDKWKEFPARNDPFNQLVQKWKSTSEKAIHMSRDFMYTLYSVSSLNPSSRPSLSTTITKNPSLVEKVGEAYANALSDYVFWSLILRSHLYASTTDWQDERKRHHLPFPSVSQADTEAFQRWKCPLGKYCDRIDVLHGMFFIHDETKLKSVTESLQQRTTSQASAPRGAPRRRRVLLVEPPRPQRQIIVTFIPYVKNNIGEQELAGIVSELNNEAQRRGSDNIQFVSNQGGQAAAVAGNVRYTTTYYAYLTELQEANIQRLSVQPLRGRFVAFLDRSNANSEINVRRRQALRQRFGNLYYEIYTGRDYPENDERQRYFADIIDSSVV
jgi:hypothetical protein